MRGIACFILVIVVILGAGIRLLPIGQGQTLLPVIIGIDVAHANLHATQSELLNFTSLVEANGGVIDYSRTTLNQTFLSSIRLLIISAPTTNYSSLELSALSNWYSSGGSVWILGSIENSSALVSINQILGFLGSSLRLENGFAADPIYNLKGESNDSNDLLAPILNHSQAASVLTTDLRVVFGYKPIPIIGYTGSSFTRFSQNSQPAASMIASTASSASIFNISSTLPLRVYSNGEEASVPITVTEHVGRSRLAVVGFPVLSSWKGLFSYSPNTPYDNRILVKNLLAWLTRMVTASEVEMTYPMLKAGKSSLVSIDNASDNPHLSAAEIQPIKDILTGLGLDSREFASFAPDFVGNASAIIIQEPHRPLNPDERTQVINWLLNGNKTLILASMGDHSLNGNASESWGLNTLLLDIRSHLRFEVASVYDPEVNLGDPYYALASDINHQSSQAFNLTSNVRSLYFQFGTILDGVNQTTPIRLESNLSSPLFQNVTWLSRTSNSSYLLHLSTVHPLLAHIAGDRGSFITSALERIGTNRIVLLGGPIFTGFSGLLRYPTLYDFPVDNLLFIRNIFTSLLPQAQIATEMNVIVSPETLILGAKATFGITYTERLESVSNLTQFRKVAVPQANITFRFNGAQTGLTLLSNGTNTALIAPTDTGSLSWTAIASAKGYQNQTGSGTIKVTPPPVQFGLYVLSIPILLFIAVTIYVTYRKAR